MLAPDSTSGDVLRMVSDRVREGFRLDYKETANTANRDEKREFLADVSSFANAEGGQILIGVREERDDAGKPTGLPVEACGVDVPNAGAECLRLDNLLRDLVKPRIPGVAVWAIEGFRLGPVFVIHIPASGHAPHMISMGNTPFFTRQSEGKYSMDAFQIRSAFANLEAGEARPESFRRTRVESAMSQLGPMPVNTDEPALFVHIVPVGDRSLVDFTSSGTILPEVKALNSGGHNRRLNFDGLLTYRSGENGCAWWVQLLRDGAAEVYVTSGLHFKMGIRAAQSEALVVRQVADHLARLENWQSRGGVAVLLTWVNVRGLELYWGGDYFSNDNAIDRDMLPIPDVFIGPEIAADQAAVARELKPAFDVVAQAAGWPGSNNFDEQGDWTVSPIV